LALRVAAVALAFGVLGSALATQAGAYVYWTGSTIGRANLDGSEVDQSFITGANGQWGVEVDAGHIYWANAFTDTIGRANLDGSEVDQSFITGASYPLGLAIGAGYIYWANASSDTIGRANLNGSEVDQSFITGTNVPVGVAVDAEHIYWASLGSETIGRANLSGSQVEKNFISPARNPQGVAVNAVHVYWANYSEDEIGRANLNGSEVEQGFITGASYPQGVAVDARHIYWANDTGNTIGRANLDGSEVNQSFITLAGGPVGVTVSPQESTVSCAKNTGAIKLSPGLTKTPAVQTLKVKGTMTECTGEPFREVNYNATLTTTGPVSCSVLTGAGGQASGAIKYKWTPKAKASSGTLAMPLTETPATAFFGEVTLGSYSPLMLSGTAREGYSGGVTCGEKIGKSPIRAVTKGTFEGSAVSFE